MQFLLDIYFLDKGALIIVDVGLAYKGPLIQKVLLVLLKQRPLDQRSLICKPNFLIIYVYCPSRTKTRQNSAKTETTLIKASLKFKEALISFPDNHQGLVLAEVALEVFCWW